MDPIVSKQIFDNIVDVLIRFHNHDNSTVERKLISHLAFEKLIHKVLFDFGKKYAIMCINEATKQLKEPYFTSTLLLE